MIELIPIPAIIIVCLIYTIWRKAYLSQTLVIANFLIFMYYFIIYHQDPTNGSTGWEIVDAYAFVPIRIGQIEYLHTVVTSMFMHGGPLHIIMNMLILYLLGLPLEERIGTARFGAIYFITGIGATASYYLLNMGSDIHALGASGAIFGIGGAFLILYPRDEIPMLIGPLFTSRAPVWISVGVMFAIESAYLIATETHDLDTGVGHIAHIGGAVCGIVVAPLIVRKKEDETKVQTDFSALRQLAMNKDDLAIVDKIENETEPDVREAWLDFFFTESARCPKCNRHVKRADVIRCECGQTVKLTK